MDRSVYPPAVEARSTHLCAGDGSFVAGAGGKSDQAIHTAV
jgi:hypothetical protein